MNIRFLFSIFIFIFLMLRVDGFAASALNIKNISGGKSIYSNSSPLLSATTVVWQAKGGLPSSASGGSDWEIFVYDVMTQVLVQITDDNSHDISPKTDGEFVVWQKHVSGEKNQVFIYNIQDDAAVGGSQISDVGNVDNFAPKIASGKVVWTAQYISDCFEPEKIMLYDAVKKSGPDNISNSEVDSSNPKINDRYVVWLQDFDNELQSTYVYDLLNKSQVASAHGLFAGQLSSSVDGLQRVLSRYDGNDREILLYTSMDGYVQLTDNTKNDTNPVISQNYVAWKNGSNIYLADIAQFIRVSLTENETVKWSTGFKAQWIQLSGGVSVYYVEVSTEPDFSSFRILNAGNTAEYRVEGLVPGATYYYRVKAIINGSETAYSQSMPVTLENLDDKKDNPEDEKDNSEDSSENQSDPIAGDESENSDLDSTPIIIGSGGGNSIEPVVENSTDDTAENDNDEGEDTEFDEFGLNDGSGDSWQHFEIPRGDGIGQRFNNAYEIYKDSSSDFVLEIGKIDIDATWSTVIFSKYFKNPVVVIAPLHADDMEFFSIRLRNIDSKGFEVRLKKWDTDKGGGARKKISYVVVEKGHFTLDDGTKIEAGIFSGSKTIKQVSFKIPFLLNPVVISSIISTDNSNTLSGYVLNPERAHFYYKLAVYKPGKSNQRTELVTYIAWENGKNKIASLLNELISKGSVNYSQFDPNFQNSQNKVFQMAGKNLDEASGLSDTGVNDKEQLSVSDDFSQEQRTKRGMIMIACLALFQVGTISLLQFFPLSILKKILIARFF